MWRGLLLVVNLVWTGQIALTAAGSVGVVLDRLSGDTSYQAGGDYIGPDGTRRHFVPISQLEFPLDVYTAGLRGDWRLHPRVTVKLRATINLDDHAGTMIDEDYGVYTGRDDSLDVRSTSRTELEGYWLSVGAHGALLRRASWAWTAGLRYRFQYLDFAMYDLHQTYPSSSSVYAGGLPPHDEPGEVLGYTVEYHLPLIETGVDWERDRVGATCRLGWAPWAFAEDEARHLLRDKRTVCRAHGFAFGVGATSWVALGADLALRVHADWLHIEIDGHADVYDSAGAITSSEHFIDSDQVRFGAGVDWRF